MENQIERNIENEMDNGILQLLMRSWAPNNWRTEGILDDPSPQLYNCRSQDYQQQDKTCELATIGRRGITTVGRQEPTCFSKQGCPSKRMDSKRIMVVLRRILLKLCLSCEYSLQQASPPMKVLISISNGRRIVPSIDTPLASIRRIWASEHANNWVDNNAEKLKIQNLKPGIESPVS